MFNALTKLMYFGCILEGLPFCSDATFQLSMQPCLGLAAQVGEREATSVTPALHVCVRDAASCPWEPVHATGSTL